MLYGHTVSALLAPRYQTGTWFDIWVFQRGLTSSLFLLLSGFAFSIATGRHWASHTQFSPAVLKRLRRFSLFVVLGYALHFPVQRFVQLPSATPEQWRSFLAVDVLQLIGVTFIGVQTMVLVARSRRVFAWAAFFLALTAVLVTPLFWGADWARRLPLWLSAYLTPSTGSQFPVFPWAAYVLVGVALGQWYLRWGPARLDWYANVALFAPWTRAGHAGLCHRGAARVADRRRSVGRGPESSRPAHGGIAHAAVPHRSGQSAHHRSSAHLRRRSPGDAPDLLCAPVHRVRVDLEPWSCTDLRSNARAGSDRRLRRPAPCSHGRVGLGTGTGGSTRARASRAGRPWGLAFCSCTAFFNSQRPSPKSQLPPTPNSQRNPNIQVANDFQAGQPTSKPRQQSH